MGKINTNPQGSGYGHESSGNIFSKMLADRKARKEAKQNRKAAAVADNAAERKRRIAAALDAINYNRSMLPREVLEERQKPDQEVGDHEAIRDTLVFALSQPTTVTVDLSAIDEKLLSIAKIYGTAVADGRVQQAKYARSALVQGITVIRNKVPETSPNLMQNFVSAGINQLENWEALIDMGFEADMIVENLRIQEIAVAQEKERVEKIKKDLEKIITSNPAYEVALYDVIYNGRKPVSELEHKVHDIGIESRLKHLDHEFLDAVYRSTGRQFVAMQERNELVYTNCKSVNYPQDPALFENYKDQVKQAYDQIVANDEMVAETLTFMSEIDDMLKAHQNSVAVQILNESSVSQLQADVDAINEAQRARIMNETAETQHLFGTLTKEEEAQAIKERTSNRQLVLEAN